MRESEVEKYLVEKVTNAHGETRKMKWIGRAHAPDRFVALPGGFVALVELKAPHKAARAGQEREHNRLRRLGVKVYLLDTPKAVDRFMGDWARDGGT